MQSPSAMGKLISGTHENSHNLVTDPAARARLAMSSSRSADEHIARLQIAGRVLQEPAKRRVSDRLDNELEEDEVNLPVFLQKRLKSEPKRAQPLLRAHGPSIGNQQNLADLGDAQSLRRQASMKTDLQDIVSDQPSPAAEEKPFPSYQLEPFGHQQTEGKWARDQRQERLYSALPHINVLTAPASFTSENSYLPPLATCIQQADVGFQFSNQNPMADFDSRYPSQRQAYPYFRDPVQHYVQCNASGQPVPRFSQGPFPSNADSLQRRNSLQFLKFNGAYSDPYHQGQHPVQFDVKVTSSAQNDSNSQTQTTEQSSNASELKLHSYASAQATTLKSAPQQPRDRTGDTVTKTHKNEDFSVEDKSPLNVAKEVEPTKPTLRARKNVKIIKVELSESSEDEDDEIDIEFIPKNSPFPKMLPIQGNLIKIKNTEIYRSSYDCYHMGLKLYYLILIARKMKELLRD